MGFIETVAAMFVALVLFYNFGAVASLLGWLLMIGFALILIVGAGFLIWSYPIAAIFFVIFGGLSWAAESHKETLHAALTKRRSFFRFTR